MNREQFENQFKKLEGQELLGVSYYEITYEGRASYWNDSPLFDSLDHGLDLITASGKTFPITWGAEFLQYGISLASKPLDQFLNDYNKTDATICSRWKDLVGQKIVSSEIIWETVEDANEGLKTEYPQDAKIKFSNGTIIFISALEIREDDSASEFADHITVFFDQATANKYKVGE